MFQVPWVVKFEVVRVEKDRTNCFGLFSVERALEWVVKKPLGRVRKAGDYLRFFGWLCSEASFLFGLFNLFAPVGVPGTTPVC